MTEPAKLPKKAKGSRPYFFDDPAVDKAIAIVMGLAGEVSVMHDRLDTIERLLSSNGTLSRDDIEGFEVDASVSAARDAWRDRFLDNVLRIVHQELEDPDGGRANDPGYEQAIDSVLD
jgi:hypothetical protein